MTKPELYDGAGSGMVKSARYWVCPPDTRVCRTPDVRLKCQITCFVVPAE